MSVSTLATLTLREHCVALINFTDNLTTGSADLRVLYKNPICDLPQEAPAILWSPTTVTAHPFTTTTTTTTSHRTFRVSYISVRRGGVYRLVKLVAIDLSIWADKHPDSLWGPFEEWNAIGWCCLDSAFLAAWSFNREASEANVD